MVSQLCRHILYEPLELNLHLMDAKTNNLNKRQKKSQFRNYCREKKRKLELSLKNLDDVTLDRDSEQNPANYVDKDVIETRIHVPKAKYAIAFGYLGTRYHGYQKQVEYGTGDMNKVETIEGTMESALVEIGAINEVYRNLPYKLQLSKSSRTDKGVHAGCTYIAGRFEIPELEEEVGTKEEFFIRKLNDALPNDIRCFQIVRVTKGFDARTMCSKRKYEYIIPEKILLKRYKFGSDKYKELHNNLSSLFSQYDKSKDPIKLSKVEGEYNMDHGFYEDSTLDIELIKEIMDMYVGTHDFQNFTVRQKVQGSTTQRYIHKTKVNIFTLSNIFHQIKKDVIGNGQNVVRITIVGQSFLYNQIRKMISMAIETYLNLAPKSTIAFSLFNNRILNTNIAPSEGLVLHHPYFDSYNMTRCSPPQTPYILYKDIKEKVEKFKEEQIYPEIANSFGDNVYVFGFFINITQMGKLDV
ncbi:tRNA pseudouridine synthase, putative [Theileria equi strain WA]|uniref:tRNA pseudouridine synthase, putative n=1 Tax=Theileria equi strain WA TaxID=1537102 RepID=L1LFX5_THEEQ|nr:tRNA pseudouridine synthase, putative [Theileria equi strain WA]EKX74327.1 tRNA pseudouridine synthase, putative [Theileria equi strain WA]|eukprot:XP_004833779.1 tRNA pseudouridine synthase, putative [Theileria equi strain WA]